MTSTVDDRSPIQNGKPNEGLQDVSIDELVELVTDCGVLVVDNPRLSDELKKRGYMVTGEGKGGKIVLHKTECEPPENDLRRLQSLVVDPYAPYSPKASVRPHPFAEDLQRHARVSAPQQIIMQSPSEPEFLRITEDLVTHDSVEQEVYADVRFRAAYTRLVGSPRLELHLMVEEVQFGVSQSFNNLSTRGHFVYALEIKALPSEKWAHHCTQTSAKPSDTYNLQRHATLGITERLSKLSLPEVTDEENEEGNIQPTGGEPADDVVKHRWFPAVYDPRGSEKAVEWTWKMTTWGDGQAFDEENPNCSSDVLPNLPYRNPEVVRFKDLEDVNEATWEVPTDVVKALHGRMDWSFEIKIYTTCLQQKKVRVGKDVVTYRKKAERVAAKYKGKTSRSNALIIPPPS
ncbi:hypothetical protein KC19_4G238500 [Ceratodon purpureus]|uniref:Uncharacterized protein n=2 Tax=Ceratodon purpureus TaxID=3225 RepID=A0A8T0IEG1_CERPU|nr:hypothetical protein KC19_4G238500 [Ceratodon purpureus]KAG0581272.1 hypothetical protein KC19_4G238500 [Ceratodon purpureus]KAG0581274.1 hypothetical protein KC19_4G238500 [Ceratodon purpureus]